MLFLLLCDVCPLVVREKTAAMPPPSDIVKVAIEWPGANAQLMEIDQVSVQSKNTTQRQDIPT